jgi:hypothetical protein
LSAFFPWKSDALILTSHGLGYILGNFSQTHLVTLIAKRKLFSSGLFGKRELLAEPIQIRVARWYIFKPKIQIWINFGGFCNGRCWCILCPFGTFYGHLPYFKDIWYISRLNWIFFLFWYVEARKIWQP